MTDSPVNAAEPATVVLGDREIDHAADEMARKRILPRPPGRKISFDEAQEWFKLLTPEMWNHVMVYVYRDHPKILRQLSNPDNARYIDCVSQPIDMDYMIEHHGGGHYTLMACDTEVKFKASGNRLFECAIDINASQHEPKLNYEELDVNAKQNMAYVQLLQYRGILDSKGHPMAPQPNTAAASNSDIVRDVLSFVSDMNAEQQQALRERITSNNEQSLNKSVGEILLEKMKQDDPNKQATIYLGLMKEVLAAKPADNSVGQFIQIFELMNRMNTSQATVQAEHNRTVLTMFEKLIERRNEPAPNPQITQLKELLEVTQDLAGLGGARGGGRRNGWDVGLDYVKELGGPVVNLISNFMNMRNGGRPMPPAAPMTQPGAPAAAPGAFDPYANPDALRALSQTLASNPAAPAAPGAPNELAGLMQTYGGLLINHLNNGTPGHEFADLVAGLMGHAVHAQICAQGEPPLVQMLLSIPESAVFGEAYLRTFVHQFVHYREFLEADEEPGDDEPEVRGAAAGAVHPIA